MKKYLVIAQTYNGWGAEYHLFAICDSEEEAIKFVMDNPVQQIGEETFDFFNDYEKQKVRGIYEDRSEMSKPNFRMKIRISENIISKEEYVKEQFIIEFNNSPIYIGGYIE